MNKFFTSAIALIAVVLYSSIVVVKEGSRGIMLRFEKAMRDLAEF